MTLPQLASELTSLAHSQGGFITRGQILKFDPPTNALRRLTFQGILEREQRGLYRLSTITLNDDAELWRAVLWPMVDRPDQRPATLCLGSALSLYDVSTIEPNEIAIAVSSKSRMRRTNPPPPKVKLERRNYPPSDVTSERGLPLTTLFRTIADMIIARRDLQFIDEALSSRRAQIVLTSKDIEVLTAMRNLDSRAISLLREEV